MKKIVFHILIIIFCFKSALAQTNIYDTIKYASLNRTFLLHIPPSYSSQTSTPLVIGLHGGGSPGWETFEQASQLIEKSNKSGFLLVYPEGVKVVGKRTWNGGGCCSFAVTAKIDDVGFINALIDTIISKYNVDAKRIYATGLSNGAIMSYRLASQLSDRIAAIAPVSGTLEDSGFVFNPSRPVSIIQFHSTLDSNIFLQGGFGTNGYTNHKFNSVNYGLEKFASIDKCIFNPDSNYYKSGSSFYYKKSWQNCDCGVAQILYVTGDGGHSWPGGNIGLGVEADQPSSIIYANDSIWNFFQKHSLICNKTSRIDESNLNSNIDIYPNPFSIQTTLQTKNSIKNGTLIVCNLFGHKVKQINNISNQTIIFHRDNLQNGLYLLQLINDNKIIGIVKLVIIDN
jgi:polyhydroxybutyrate depolymerase